MPGRNQPRSRRGRSAIARTAMNTNSTNGLGINNGGGMKKGGAHPSATGFMRSKPWQISVPARKQMFFNMNKMNNNTNIGSVVDEKPHVTDTLSPSPSPPPSETLTGKQLDFLKSALLTQITANQQLINPIPWPENNPDCTNGHTVLTALQAYVRGISNGMKNATNTGIINSMSKNLYVTFNDSFPTKNNKLTVPPPLYYINTGLAQDSSYNDYSNLITQISTICSGTRPSGSDEPSAEQWTALHKKFDEDTGLSHIFSSLPLPYKYPLQSQCSPCSPPAPAQCASGGVQTYISAFTDYIPTMNRSISDGLTLGIADVNLATKNKYKYSIGSVINPPAAVKPPPGFVFSYKKNDSEITITVGDLSGDDAINEYVTFYTKTLYDYCSYIQDYTALLGDQEICFKDTDTEITALIAEMKNPKSIKSCIGDPTSCILKNNTSELSAISLQTYIKSLDAKFTTLYTAAKKTTPITLQAAKDLVVDFNQYSTEQFAKATIAASDDNLTVVLLSEPKSMDTPISGCLWGNIPTTIGHIQDKFSEAVTPCTLSPACITPTKLAGTCKIPDSSNWKSYDDIFSDACTLTSSGTVSEDTIMSLCTLTTDLRYMTGGKVWDGSIGGIKDMLTKFFKECCSGTRITVNNAYRDLVKGSYIPTTAILVPNVASDIKKVKASAAAMSLDGTYKNYSAYFNKMRVWLTFYYGPQVGGFLVNALETNYLNWYNLWHAGQKPMSADDFKTVTDLMWSPAELSGTTAPSPPPSPPPKDCSLCSFGTLQGCYIKDATNISTNYCCIENDQSGCKNASTSNVCFNSSKPNAGNEKCFEGRDFSDCWTPPSKDCSQCTFGDIQGCYIKDAANISTNYCCTENDPSGCKNASTSNVCLNSSAGNVGDDTCLSGNTVRDFSDCSTMPLTPSSQSQDGHEGKLQIQVTALQKFLSSKDYTDFLDSLLKVRTLQSIISQGKYTLAIGMEYASNDKTIVDDILDVLKLLPDNLKALSTDLKAIRTLNVDILNEFLSLLRGGNVATFNRNLATHISKTYTDAFKKSIVDISGFIDTSYNPMVNTINTTYKNIKSCNSSASPPACGSTFPGSQASIWQDTGSMWSHFPSPDELTPIDSNKSTTIDGIFGPWFEKNAENGVFNYHLSFAQLDVVADILSTHPVDRKVDTSTLNDTILPYVIQYKIAYGSSSLKAAYAGFLGDLKNALKTHTNGKGKLGLSFGGENATTSDNRYLSVGKTTTADAVTMADAFYKTILENVDSVDFDNENAGFNPVDQQETFFQQIRKNITKDYGQIDPASPKYPTQPKMMLTLLGNPATSTGLGMQPLMAKGAQYFDGINLMLYDNGTGYYITANEGTAWSLQSWATAIDISTSTPENILNAYNKLSPCYQDQTPYNDPNADKGESGPNWAAESAAPEIQANYGVDITTLSVGEAAWVLNRQFLYDALSSYRKVTDASMQEFITNKADTVSWWPDNNLHGSLCPDTNDKGCNQYGVQQAFSACQILFKLGYNPFTFKSNSQTAVSSLLTTINELNTTITHLHDKIQLDISNALTKGQSCDFNSISSNIDAVEQYIGKINSALSTNITKDINTIITDLNSISQQTGFPTSLSRFSFSYIGKNTYITITPDTTTYITAMSNLFTQVQTISTKCCTICGPQLQKPIITGYICPTAPSSTDNSGAVQLLKELPAVYNIVVFSFLILTGGTGPETETFFIKNGKGLQDGDVTTAITTLHNNNKLAFLSLGGGGPPTPTIDGNNNNDKFIETMANGIVAWVIKYNFDGLDHDIEARAGDLDECGQLILKVIAKIKTELPNLFISCAPQVPNINPGEHIISTGVNEYAPILGGDVSYNNKTIKGIELFDIVQPQFYNAWDNVYTPQYQKDYIERLNTGFDCTSLTGKKYHVVVPYSKIVMGFPAAKDAAPSGGYVDPPELLNNNILPLFTATKIIGVMTWSIGWDKSNDYAWSDAMKKLTSSHISVSTTQDAYGANKYSIDGVQQKDLTLQVGKTYDFFYPQEHPLRFSAIPDGTHTHLSTYIEEIPQTHITQISATQISFTVTEDMPKKIYYYCGNHPGMGAMITIEN